MIKIVKLHSEPLPGQLRSRLSARLAGCLAMRWARGSSVLPREQAYAVGLNQGAQGCRRVEYRRRGEEEGREAQGVQAPNPDGHRQC